MIGQIFDAMPDFPKSREIPKNPALVWGVPDPPEGNLGKQDSPNHRDMAHNAELARAAAYGTPAEYETARETVLFELDLHMKRLGMWTREQFTGTPHGGMYLNAAFAGRVGARKKGDTELLKLQDEYLRRIFTYMAATATPGGEVLCCGERMPKDPIAVQQSAVYRELHGLPHPHKAKIEKQLQDDLWVPLRGFRALRASGDTFGGVQEITSDTVTTLPFVKHPIEVQRWPGGHLARYLSRTDAGKAGVTDWVLVDYEQADRGKKPLAGVSFSVGFAEPAPVARVPAGARKIQVA
ncbi:MAG TPA: hypothetical protein VGX68_02175 [Thermoanaerobaculia bacterium]|nr:hypothetical protein [Thermoanaerobaculia bacterium]